MTPRDTAVREKVLAFGPYLLFRSTKILTDRGRRVRLGARALEILAALVERAGEVVSKNELMNIAWPNTVVQENNLRVHVAAIRKLLGDSDGGSRYIINVQGRGYSFVAPVARVDVPDAEWHPESDATQALPSPMTRVVGRDAVIGVLAAKAGARRLLTIVGPGGIGKTTVAVAVAERLAGMYRRLCFIDLSTVEDPALVPSAVATIIGISVQAADPVSSLISFLGDKSLLIVLDNCEHVIEAAASLVERLLQASAGVDIIATSREPLRAAGENLCHLPPLATPPESSTIGAMAAAKYAAVQLFVERASGGMETFELTDANAGSVSSICRRLDGMPLAIELVASRVFLFGVNALGSGFGDDVILAAKGRRTAKSRHQSLRDTLDWSYQRLPPIEQAILRRLTVFRGTFSAESAAAVVSGASLAGNTRLSELLMSLAAKNLLTTDISGPVIRYRLLHVTRAYASERLADSDERSELCRRHAEHLRSLLDSANDDWDKMSREQWLYQYGSLIDDARAAMDWAFSPRGNLQLGAALTIASLPFGFQLSLIDETTRRANLALGFVTQMEPPRPLWEMRINNALTALFSSTGASEAVVLATTERALALAQAAGIDRYSIEPLTNRAAVYYHVGDFAAAMETAEELERVARRTENPIANLIADRIGAQANHFAGNHVKARALVDRVLRHPARTIPLSYGQVGVNHQVSMRIIWSRILWLEGHADHATRLAAETVELAKSDGPTAICHALGIAACPIAFWTGDMDSARELTNSLLEYSRRYSFHPWTALGSCYEQSIKLILDDPKGGVESALSPSIVIADIVPLPEILPTISGRWLNPLGHARERRALFGWASPEVIRLTAATREQCGAPLDAVALLYHESLDLAKRQKALAWELRTTLGLARFWDGQGRRADARRILQSVYDRFSEGFGTKDLEAARDLLREFGEAQ